MAAPGRVRQGVRVAARWHTLEYPLPALRVSWGRLTTWFEPGAWSRLQRQRHNPYIAVVAFGPVRLYRFPPEGGHFRWT